MAMLLIGVIFFWGGCHEPNVRAMDEKNTTSHATGLWAPVPRNKNPSAQLPVLLSKYSLIPFERYLLEANKQYSDNTEGSKTQHQFSGDARTRKGGIGKTALGTHD